MSGRPFVLGLLLAGLLAGCGATGAPVDEERAYLLPDSARQQEDALPPLIPAGNGPETLVGEPISEKGATILSMPPDGRQVEPVAAYGEKIVVKSRAALSGNGAEPFEYLLWDPETGMAEPAWASEPGGQDIVTDSDGGWIATVRTGMELPFPDWALILRNIATGEVREIAGSVPGIGDEGLEPLLPIGFAPYPAISGGRVAWVEGNHNADGVVIRRVQLYTIETGETRTLFESVAGEGDCWAVALAGSTVAWAFRADDASEIMIRVVDLESGEQRDIDDVGEPFSVALSGDGGHLAWDDSMTAKYALDLTTGERLQYAGAIGWGAAASGDYVSWIPASGRGGRAGFYSFSTGEVRFREDIPGAMMNLARVMGPWFVWQERPLDPALPGSYYFIRLAGS